MKRFWTWVLCTLALVVQAQTTVQPMRDPTLPPVGAEGGTTDEGPLTARLSSSNVVVREGKPYLVVGSRLVAPGQTVESFQLERITETEIWLRDASGITKVQRFAGVQRQVQPEQCSTRPAVPVKKKSAKKRSPNPRKVAPPPTPKTGAGVAPRPTRENDPHDC
jgi:hypothetical protein